MTIVEFLRARLDEVPVGGTPSPWERDVLDVVHRRSGTTVARDCYGDDAEHIAYWDPGRVLAEVNAKRRIVDEHWESEVASIDHETWGQTFIVCRRCRIGERQVVMPCPTLRLLALPYADHPDYDEEWRP